ncbi:MAG: RNA polymerase sigma-70 factor, ECF subfamily [Candidatus Magasanikbacteria bacterium GW2011_GWA2_46_17]|uniref:RNA polymerase sigma-70 factor, ECF subfamily n=1 Tax=Candidatus Magasanikbacteria bacterium GW2011_GWA2_46_17 TaxID=1619042 RepID=A0A0G1NZ12_9BACT|nr:MAG: RNA polymerase sigma-70 factor, ECF subfamily [Candidatus Magasanikbacteria bacterium GW2011_GWA2_46_17]
MAVLAKLTDEQIVEAVRLRDKELYSEIIRRYQAKLTHYLRKFIGNQDELEDVLQVVFIKTYRNLYGFDTAKRFSSWIYRIAHNEAVNQIKKYSRKAISLDENEWELIDDKMDVNEKTDASLFKAKVERGLTMISKKYRDPIVLYFFEQKTYEEISDILRLPRNTVGTLIMRGKGMLRGILAED